jgi:hypothetical protein
MTGLGQPDNGKDDEPVYYCDKHGVLNKTVAPRGRASGAAKRPQWLRTD